LDSLGRLSAYVRSHRQTLYGPDQKYVCLGQPRVAEYEDPEICFQMYESDKVSDLYPYPSFRNALNYSNRARPDVVAAAASYKGQPIAVAGASADSDLMYQVGVDVEAPFRRKGIGAFLVGKVTEKILQMGKVPYYTTSLSNLASRNLAVKAGYRPMWVEIYSK